MGIVKNLTGHEIVLGNGEESIVLPSEGRAIVENKQEYVMSVFVNESTVLIPVYIVSEQEVLGLPDEQEGVLLIVSGLAAAVAGRMGRKDVVCPGRVDRQGGGRVTAARALLRIEGREEISPESEQRKVGNSDEVGMGCFLHEDGRWTHHPQCLSYNLD